MGVEIHAGFMQVIQPIVHATAAKSWSVTYAINVEDASNPAQACLNLSDTAFRLQWRPLLDTNMTFQPAVGYYNDGSGPLTLLTSTVAAQAGQAARNSPPPNVATVVRKRTAFVGKAYRGRCFFPGLLDETNVDENGVITPAGVIALQNAANAWLAGQIDAQGGLWLLHSKSLVLPNRVTALVVQPIVRTQRRRLPRG